MIQRMVLCVYLRAHEFTRTHIFECLWGGGGVGGGGGAAFLERVYVGGGGVCVWGGCSIS